MQESIVFLVRVQRRHKESSRSLSHFLMSFLSLTATSFLRCKSAQQIPIIVTLWGSQSALYLQHPSKQCTFILPADAYFLNLRWLKQLVRFHCMFCHLGLVSWLQWCINSMSHRLLLLHTPHKQIPFQLHELHILTWWIASIILHFLVRQSRDPSRTDFCRQQCSLKTVFLYFILNRRTSASSKGGSPALTVYDGTSLSYTTAFDCVPAASERSPVTNILSLLDSKVS